MHMRVPDLRARVFGSPCGLPPVTPSNGTMDELYLENIDELIADHNKIVTYKWLSHTLGVHVNQAKQMLYDYVTRKRKENVSAQVHVTYLVTGKCMQDGYSYHKVAVVREEKLEAAKSKLALLANVHVYSIQKATLKDSAPLFSTDYDIIKNNLQNCSKFSAIQCAAAVPRSPDELAQLQRNNYQDAQEVTVPTKPKVNGHALPPAAKAAPQQPKGIMGMFSRQAAKPQEVQKPAAEPKAAAAPETSSKSSAKSSAMDNFFGKASLNKFKDAASTNVPVKAEKPAEPPAETPPPPPPSPPPVKGVKGSEPPKAAAKEKKRNKRVEMSDDEQDKPAKTTTKRRRIKKPRPDSSDEEDAVPLPREVKTPPPPPAPEPVVKMETESQPQTQSGEKRRKRKRVLKSKTFVDDEGCIVTEKVYESESCTDSGEEVPASRPAAAKPSAASKAEPKAETKASKKMAAASKGTKQPSIMGFFQKK
ncbi:DNA polymerase delta subunit 3 isoform X2 [Pseudophryne corroboree]|uniref:DNA polymerase delta subunit 3 isoform X2 n=1 Tax=Pseudophryne corroboree TaxID=495146 RepID=UPI0030813B56